MAKREWLGDGEWLVVARAALPAPFLGDQRLMADQATGHILLGAAAIETDAISRLGGSAGRVKDEALGRRAGPPQAGVEQWLPPRAARRDTRRLGRDELDLVRVGVRLLVPVHAEAR